MKQRLHNITDSLNQVLPGGYKVSKYVTEKCVSENNYFT